MIMSLVDIRCPRCGSLMGRADGKAQFRCHKARCFAIVNVDTATGEMELTRYGGGPNVRHVHEAYSVQDVSDKYESGYFREVRF